jgi:hypothetical protein
MRVAGTLLRSATDHETRPRAVTARDVLAIVALALAVGALAYAYMRQERFVYYWDYANFHVIAVQLADALMADPRAGATMFVDALAREYNLIFALPLLPIIVLTDGSRLAFVVALAVLYLVPFALTIGVICRRVFPQLGRAAQWIGTLLAIAVPPVWSMVMRGYPDVLGAAVLLAGLAVLLGDVRLERWSTVLWTAFAIAAAVAIRRHLAYASLAMLGTAALTVALHWFETLRAHGMPAVLDDARGGRLLRAAALPPAALGFLMVVNPFFAGMVLQNDYGNLYASYQLPPGELLKVFSYQMGRPFLVLAALGIIVGLVRWHLRCTPVTALSLFGSTWLVLWLGVARQYSPHHVIVTMPLMAIAGVLQVADLLRASARPTWAGLWLALVLVYVGAGAIVVYGPWTSAYVAVQQPTMLLSTYYGPLIRHDFDELRQLVGALREGRQPTLVGASNGVLNYELVDRAETQLFGNRGRKRLSVLLSPQIDSRDARPVEDLLRSGQVVVVTPFQYHLTPSEQDVVRVVIDALTRDWPIARDFVRGTRTFHLDGGTEAAVYRRVAPTSIEVALDTFRRVREEAGVPPERFRDVWYWSGDQLFGTSVTLEGARDFHFGPPMPPPTRPLALTMLRPVRGHLRVEGEALLEASACGAMRLKLMQVGSDAVHGAVDVPTGRPVPFGFSLAASEPVNLMLRFERTGADAACRLNITNLRIIEAP